MRLQTSLVKLLVCCTFFVFGSVSWHCSIVVSRHSLQCWYQLGIAWLCSSTLTFFDSHCIPVLNNNKAVCSQCTILLLELKVWQNNEISVKLVESPVILQRRRCSYSQTVVDGADEYDWTFHLPATTDVCDKCYSYAKSPKRTCSF